MFQGRLERGSHRRPLEPFHEAVEPQCSFQRPSLCSSAHCLFFQQSAVIRPCQVSLSGEKRPQDHAQTSGYRHHAPVASAAHVPSHSKGETRRQSRCPRPESASAAQGPAGRASCFNEDLRPQAADGGPEETLLFRAGEHERGWSFRL